jgi:hypothetical protein
MFGKITLAATLVVSGVAFGQTAVNRAKTLQNQQGFSRFGRPKAHR